MTSEQIYGMLRIGVPMLLALMVKWGWFPQSVVDTLTEPLIQAIIAVVTVSAMIWSAITNRPKALILKAKRAAEDTAVDAAPPVATQEHRL